MILDEGNHLNNTPSHKRNYAGKKNLEKLGKKSSEKITVQTTRHKIRVIPTTEKGHSL